MKTFKIFVWILTLTVVLSACGSVQKTDGVTEIYLGEEIRAEGANETAVSVVDDIVYYEAGTDFTYGEGTEADGHSPEEAAAHRVVHITKAGTYRLQGTLPLGQIAVDLGEEAKEDPNAVVTLILNGVDITCEVAPAVIFYNVYECGSDDTENATKDVDTSAAGANVIIADDTVNQINGSYVARIYQPETVVLSEDGTQVEDAEKLHKYDAAFYSRMSMNVDGGEEDSGVLNIRAENEGLDSELHLTINGGSINITSGNDGINTNEDGISVTTINGGMLDIVVTGETGEGDGIDSNGWLVINGGTVVAEACSHSADAGIDSDMGIHIGGGTVFATGYMLDRIEEGGRTYAVFQFAEKQGGGEPLSLKNEAGEEVVSFTPRNDYSVVVFSSPELVAGTYTLWRGERQLQGHSGGMGSMMPGGTTPQEMPEGMELPEGMERPEPPEGMEFPEGMERPEPPEGMEFPEGMEGMTPPGKPDGPQGGFAPHGKEMEQEAAPEFVISHGGNLFAGIAPLK